jgi:hypothetical protein
MEHARDPDLVVQRLLLAAISMSGCGPSSFSGLYGEALGPPLTLDAGETWEGIVTLDGTATPCIAESTYGRAAVVTATTDGAPVSVTVNEAYSEGVAVETAATTMLAPSCPRCVDEVLVSFQALEPVSVSWKVEAFADTERCDPPGTYEIDVSIDPP